MSARNHIVKKVRDYIENNLEQEINLEQIAKSVNYSKFHLNRIFAEETGCTIHKYLQTRRLAIAAEKLTKTDISIAQIAQEAGYQSQQAFSLAFKQVYFCPPKVYRSRSHFTGKNMEEMAA